MMQANIGPLAVGMLKPVPLRSFAPSHQFINRKTVHRCRRPVEDAGNVGHGVLYFAGDKVCQCFASLGPIAQAFDQYISRSLRLYCRIERMMVFLKMYKIHLIS